MTTKTTHRQSEAAAFLEKLVGPLTLGRFLEAIREGEGWSQEAMGRRLGVSRAHICDIEKGRRTVSPERAARFAKILGYSEEQMVELALQAEVDAAKLHLQVSVGRTDGKKAA
jgi:transcriptional regulator with XRE-family HTH domain